jgi:dihydroorotase
MTLASNSNPADATPLLLKRVRPIGFAEPGSQLETDILIDALGHIVATGPDQPVPVGATVKDLKGAFLSPGWVDLHTHIYHGATDISVRAKHIGLATGVTTLVDAGSAGEANFVGFNEYVAEVAQERIFAILNIGSIGLVACNRVSELIDHRSIDVDRTLDCIAQNRHIIRGVKVRASGVIVGGWGITPVKIAKKIARLTKLPLMVHVGEVPPLVEEVFELLTEGDIVTHCFHGKRGGNLMEDQELCEWAKRLSDMGVVMDIGHGAASFSYEVAMAGMSQGLYPTTISTDLHLRNIGGPVWDLSLVMSKMLALQMPLHEVIAAASTRALKAIREPWQGLLAPGARADFTAFTLENMPCSLPDAMGHPLNLQQLIRPCNVVLGNQVLQAQSRYEPSAHASGAYAGNDAC